MKNENKFTKSSSFLILKNMFLFSYIKGHLKKPDDTPISCPQGVRVPYIMTEDCLILNVWTPHPRPKSAAVMVRRCSVFKFKFKLFGFYPFFYTIVYCICETFKRE